jgi:hypothetical protein
MMHRIVVYLGSAIRLLRLCNNTTHKGKEQQFPEITIFGV